MLYTMGFLPVSSWPGEELNRIRDVSGRTLSFAGAQRRVKVVERSMVDGIDAELG